MLKAGSLKDFSILVTGACGFIGVPLVKALLKKGATVLGIDRHHVVPVGTEKDIPYSNFHFIVGDFLKKSDKAASLLAQIKKDYTAVFHLAGKANATGCRIDPIQAFEANVLLVQRILEFCRNNNIKKFGFPSTGLVYGDQSEFSINENYPTKPNSLYAATKLSAEMLIQGYASEYDMNCIIARLSNVYGPKSSTDTVIGTIVDQAKKNKRILVRDTSPIRDFIYIDDVVNGLIRLLISIKHSGSTVVNLSTGKGETIKRAVELAGMIMAKDQKDYTHATDKEQCNSKLVLDNSLLESLTEWKPENDLYSGLSLILKGDKANEQKK
jgi:nucleoside-diphosphate-sugar epimerase